MKIKLFIENKTKKRINNLKKEIKNKKKIKMKIIKIPFGAGGLGHGNGSYLAPDKIEESLKESFANENGNQIDFSFQNIDVDNNDIEKSHKIIEKYIESIDEKLIIIGGDHSITYSCVKGFRNNRSNNINNKSNNNFNNILFIVFDAHPDLMKDFSPPSQESYLRNLIEEDIIKSKDCIMIGTRNWDKEEIDYLNKNKIKYYSSKEIFDKGFKNIVGDLINQIKDSKKDIYLSLDIDVVDPVEAIGTGYIEHGGMSSRELIYFLQKIKETKKIKMIDIVEVNPLKDINDITSKLAAKLITELGDY